MAFHTRWSVQALLVKLLVMMLVMVNWYCHRFPIQNRIAEKRKKMLLILKLETWFALSLWKSRRQVSTPRRSWALMKAPHASSLVASPPVQQAVARRSRNKMRPARRARVAWPSLTSHRQNQLNNSRHPSLPPQPPPLQHRQPRHLKTRKTRLHSSRIKSVLWRCDVARSLWL